MPIIFENDFIDRLNRTSGKGKVIKAAILTETLSPLVKKYWADHEEPITFQGNTYQPLHMFWENVKTGVGMTSEGANIGLSNLGNQVVKYLKEIDPTGNQVVLQMFNLDLIATMTRPWQRLFKVLAVRADTNAAVFILGRDFGRNKITRGVLTADEAPGLNSSVPRF